MVIASRLALAFLLVAGPLSAQTGLLVVAHGAGADWNGPVRETIAQVRWDRGPIETAFLMGEESVTSGWDSALARLVRAGAREVVVVPLMVSSFGEHYYQVRWLAGEIDSLPQALAAHEHHGRAAVPVRMRVTPALDDAPELAAALAARWGALGADDRHRPVLLVAHGPTGEAEVVRWYASLATVGAALGRAGAVGDVRAALLRDDAVPEVRAAAVAAMRDTVTALAARAADSVVVLPVMISSGAITAVRIPRDLDGLPVRYLRLPLAPLPQLARWIEASAGRLVAGAP